MNPHYLAWLEALANRDQTLVMLAGLAVALVAAWVWLVIIPVRIRRFLEPIYMVGGLMLYIVLLIRSLY